MTRSPDSLPQVVAVSVAAALVQAVATRVGARVLFIKGPVAVVQGLRPSSASADIDALVDPATFDVLVTELASRGWRARYTPEKELRIVPGHSVTLVHADWPCDLDLHYYFVGTFADPQKSFDALWADHDSLTLAGCTVAAPAPAAHRMILAINTLRDHGAAKATTEAERLAEYFRQHPDAWQSTAAYAVDTRSLSVLSIFARLHALPPVGEDLNGQEAKQFDYVMRYHSNGFGNLRYRLGNHGLGPTEKARILSHYLFKPASLIQLEHPDFQGGVWATLRANLERWAKGLNQWRAGRRTTTSASPAEPPTSEPGRIAFTSNPKTTSGREFSVDMPSHGAPYAELKLTADGVELSNAPARMPHAAAPEHLLLNPEAPLTLADCARHLDGETLYLLPLSSRAFEQNTMLTPSVLRIDASGQTILALLEDGPRSADQLVAQICFDHELQPSEVEPGVTSFLQELLRIAAVSQRSES